MLGIRGLSLNFFLGQVSIFVFPHYSIKSRFRKSAKVCQKNNFNFSLSTLITHKNTPRLIFNETDNPEVGFNGILDWT